MKVGILTYHWVSNFGANLQALSTYKFIERTGNQPVIINWIPDDVKRNYVYRVSREQNAIHEEFAKKHFTSITRICHNSNDIAQVIDEENLDIVVIGSDAVFTYKPLRSRIVLCRSGLRYFKPLSDNDFPNPFWGDFLDMVKHPIKIASLSASAQNTPFYQITSKKKKKHFQSYLERFSFLTVRDIWTREMIEYLTNNTISPTITPDPMFGFNYNVKPTDDLVITKLIGKDVPYAILSITTPLLDDKWAIELEKEFSNVGITLIGLAQTNKRFKSPLKNNVTLPLDPMDWYNLIKFSKGYIGELMHPVLVALHNSVPVFAIDLYGFKKDNKLDEKSSKTFQIMQRFGLLDNYYHRLLGKGTPTPKYVLNQVLSFDREKCAQMSKVLYLEYKSMMNKVLSI